MSFGVPVRNGLGIGLRASTALSTRGGASGPASAMSLNFLAGAPIDSRVTFTRASTATFVGSNGLIQTAAINEPRFDYDPVTLAPKGLLIEEQRTNLATYSDQFDNAVWVKLGATVTANAAVSPDGTTNADQLATTATTTGFYKLGTGTSGTSYTLSIYIKYVSGNTNYTIGTDTNPSTGNSVFNVSAGTIVSNGAGVASSSITPAGNGWYRCSVTYVATGLSSSNILYSATGGAGTALLYGIQFENAAFATSYIPTVASQVTRSADVATMTGTNFSSWYNQSEGTLLCAFIPTTLNASGLTTYTATGISDGTSNNYNVLYVYSDFAGGAIRTGAVNQADLNAGGSPANNTPIKSGIAYATNDIAVTANGTVVKTDTSATIGTTMTNLGIGNRALGNPINGHIRQIAYYNTRLSNTQLQTLTA